MEISLRPYQQKFIADVKKSFTSGLKRVCGVAPCGAGKTVMVASIIKNAVDKGKRVIFFVHRKELIDQTANTFCRFGIPFGIISAGNKPNYNLPVQIAMVQTLVNRLSSIRSPDLLVCDECHHILANSYQKIVKRFFNSYLLGVTATPERRGGIRLGDIFQDLISAASVKDLIANGYLANFKYFAPDLPKDFYDKLNNIQVTRGDYDEQELSTFARDSKYIANVVDNYQKFADGKSAICYCINIEHSKSIADKFNQAGISAAHLDGDTDKFLRARIVDDFKRGKFKILCNVDLFGEGFDVPNMDAVILARPTKSLTLFIQQSMRALRRDPLNPNKIATIVDCVDNVATFGLPDEDRQWSLAPNNDSKTGTSKNKKTYKKCPKCKRVVPLGTKFCECGYEFHGRQIVEVDSRMTEIPKGFLGYLIVAEKRGYDKYWAVVKFLKDSSIAKTVDDLISVRNFMGYQKGWVFYQKKYLSKEQIK